MSTFLDIENPNAQQHAMFEEDETMGLPVKITKKQSRQQTSSPTKRKATTTGKRTGGRPPAKPQNRGMTLQTEVPIQKATTTTTLENSSSHSHDYHSTTSSEDITPSLKRQNKKGTPPEPQRKSARNR